MHPVCNYLCPFKESAVASFKAVLARPRPMMVCFLSSPRCGLSDAIVPWPAIIRIRGTVTMQRTNAGFDWRPVHSTERTKAPRDRDAGRTDLHKLASPVVDRPTSNHVNALDRLNGARDSLLHRRALPLTSLLPGVQHVEQFLRGLLRRCGVLSSDQVAVNQHVLAPVGTF